MMTVDMAMGAIRNHGFNPTLTADGILFMVATSNASSPADDYWCEEPVVTAVIDNMVDPRELAIDLGY